MRQKVTLKPLFVERAIQQPAPPPEREPGMPEPGDPTGVDEESSEIRGIKSEEWASELKREHEPDRTGH